MNELPRLKVSSNKRFLVTVDEQPFFWLGDTAWELLHRLTREEAEQYLQNRATLRFTVIQTVALAEFDGLRTPNAYGQQPLIDNDPAKPNEAYFAHVDWIVAKANALGMYVGLLPTWGDMWNVRMGKITRGGPEIFTPQNAALYGAWLGRRYHNAGVIWIVGGDRRIDTDQHRDIIRAMAHGLREGGGGQHLITFHPPGGHSSSEWFHDADWLDFNMRQNGHTAEFNPRYSGTHLDYGRTPAKPVIDGEPLYEDHLVSHDEQLGFSTAADVRRVLYWNLFTGAFGHTYGHHSVWQMWDSTREARKIPPMPWYEAINQPGAAQMQHARALLESRPFLTRIPAPDFIVPAFDPAYIPGLGRYHFTSTRDSEGTYAMVYAPVGRAFSVRLEMLSGSQINAWWFNPRNGAATVIGTFEKTGERQFTPPDPGELADWVLVLDDASMAFPPPGELAQRLV